MIWDSAAFRVINEGRRLAASAPEDGVQLNGMMHQLIDKCFFETQMMALRRLTDDRYPLSGHRQNRDVFSLTALLSDMETRAHLLTRQNILDVEGIPYDSAPVKKRLDDYLLQKVRIGEGASSIAPELNWFRTEERHRQIDSLAGVSPERRSRTDTARPGMFGFLKEKVKGAIANLSPYVDKHLAHAASPGSRQAAGADAISLTLSDLWNAHKAICEVTQFVGTFSLGVSFIFLPFAQSDQFVYIDRPLVTEDNVGALRREWDSYEKETQEWARRGVDELTREYEEYLKGTASGGTGCSQPV
jgi:hypothetical protein